VAGLVVLVAEQPQLVLSLAAAGLRRLACARGDVALQHYPVLRLLIGQRRPVQLPPPSACLVQVPGGGAHHVADPVLVPPSGRPQVIEHRGHDRLRVLGGPANRVRIGKGVGLFSLHLE